MSEIPEDVMKAAIAAVSQDGWSIDGKSAYSDPGDSVIAMIDIIPIARAIMAERERSRTALSEAERRLEGTEYKYRIDYEYHSYIGNRKMWSFFMELSGVSLEEALEHLRKVNDNNPSKFRLMRLPVNKWEEVPEPQHGESE